MNPSSAKQPLYLLYFCAIEFAQVGINMKKKTLSFVTDIPTYYGSDPPRIGM